MYNIYFFLFDECLACFTGHVCPLAHGSVCGRRLQADAARPAAALRQAQGQREEPQAV